MFLVLVVDPDPAAPDRWKTPLEAEGCQVIAAPDGESALVAFETHLPHMVILDAELDGLSGKEVCDAIKTRTGDVFVPVMIVAAPSADGDKAAIYDAGADEFITKPVDARELTARLRSLQKIHSIANRNQQLKLAASQRTLSGGDEEVVKAVADAAAPGRKLLFRFTFEDGETAYLATDGLRVVHARLGALSGRDALNAVLCRPAGSYEVVDAVVKTGIDADLHSLTAELLADLDHWRLFSDRLAPARTTLRLNPAREAEIDSLSREAAETARAFAAPRLLDDYLHASHLDWVTAARTVAELYYGGVLLREGASILAWNGSPLTSSGGVAGSADAAPNEDLQLEVLSLNAALSKTTDELAALKTKLAQSSQEAWRESSARESALKIAEARAAELDTELVALKRRYAGRLKDLANKAGGEVMDSVIEQLSRDLQDAHSFAVSVQNAKNNAEKQAAALREEVGALKYALEESTGTIDWLKKQQQSSVEQGGSRLQNLQSEIAALKAELAESGAKRLKLQEQLQSVRRDATSVAELDELRARSAALGAEVREKNAELERLRPLAMELAKLRAELVQAVQTREAAERTAAGAQAAAARAEAESLALRSETGDTVGAAGAAHAAGLEQEAADLRERVRAAEAAADELRAGMAALTEQFELQHAEAEALRVELQDAARMRRESAEQVLVQSERVVTYEKRAAEAEARLAEQLELAAEAQAAPLIADEVPPASKALEEEVELLKTALTDAMVNAEKLQADHEAEKLEHEKAVRKLEADLFMLSAQVSTAQAETASLQEQLGAKVDGGDKTAKLEGEVGFLKARLEEAAAAEAAKRKQLEEDFEVLKAKLNTMGLERKQLEQKLAAASDASKSGADVTALKTQVATLRAEKAALEQKLTLAMEAHQRNTLLVKAQDQADLVQTLKVNLRDKEAEIAALKKQGAAGGGSNPETEAELKAARAEIDELKKKVDALRMNLLERDEEILDLSAQVHGEAGPALDEVPD